MNTTAIFRHTTPAVVAVAVRPELFRLALTTHPEDRRMSLLGSPVPLPDDEEAGSAAILRAALYRRLRKLTLAEVIKSHEFYARKTIRAYGRVGRLLERLAAGTLTASEQQRHERRLEAEREEMDFLGATMQVHRLYLMPRSPSDADRLARDLKRRFERADAQARRLAMRGLTAYAAADLAASLRPAPLVPVAPGYNAEAN